MKIMDLTPETEESFFLCLEDWNDEMRAAGDHKERWFRRMRGRGLGVKLAADDDGNIGGMIQYVPIEHSPAEGQDLYMILCIWVHGYDEGRGNFQNKGMGKALLRAAEQDAKGRGAKGLVAWGISQPYWMSAPWFEKQGYEALEEYNHNILLWKRFTGDARPPAWIRERKAPTTVPGKVSVTGFVNGWCPARNLEYERAREVSAEFGEDVVFRTVDTMDREALLEWGISDALYIDGKEVSAGPPLSCDDIRALIVERLREMGK
jgi:GNAT superfamily N-acetyltransferase